MRVLFRSGLTALVSVVAIGQAPPQPAFEDADVHASANGGNQFARGPFTNGRLYTLRTATMVDLISKAYGVDADKVLGGPNWLEYDRFDVFAKTPPNTSKDAAKLMLQTVLTDRFKLVAHKDTRPMPAYALTVGKGKPKMKEADGSGETGCKFMISAPPRPPAPPAPGAPAPAIIIPTINVTCRNMTMAAFAEQMRTIIGAQEFLGTSPVLDKTGLEGAWDFDFKVSLPLRGLLVPTAGANISFPDALDKQLGLKLEPEKVPLPVIVVESVNRTPTPNAPGVEQLLPKAPTEFEVATVRPSAPPAGGGPIRLGLQIQPGGRVNIAGLPLKLLVQQAWSVTNDMIVGAPPWMDTDRYDIVGKAPEEEGAGQGPGPGQQVDLDTVWMMVRALLAERFKLATHMEDRPMNAYTLVAAKPKMKPADPSSRTKWAEGPGPDGKDPRNTNPMLSRLVTFQNMTMAQFAEKLQSVAGGYIHSPVLDATGLQGGYDFTLSFSVAGAAGIAGGRGGVLAPDAAPGVSQASDPNGAISLFEAIEKQLGLKLETQKRPVPVLVIDHIEQKPVEN
jgi:uncharacterized protein (TIGR03435 family)